ncbi:HPr family phosphocarrier protein [Brevibacillus sp. SYSU BS000544]|uniref:HPr family phosphocarrier protein n=1 Tax=Brevibacillus sp. SYSU BS000544 TaxID=3416443 RepID=UPI003CE463D8
MKSIQVKVMSEGGLHARPASLLVSKATQFESEIMLQKGEKKANAKSILNIMALSIKQGDEIRIEASGPDEEAAITTLTELVQEQIG